MTVTFLHAADIHLGGAFVGLSRRAPDAAAALAGAAARALDNLVALAIGREVDFVVVAGDLYDAAWQDVRVGQAAAGAFGRLHAAGIPSFIIKGNHDAASVIPETARLPESAHVFGTAKPETVTLERLGVALHGWSFPDRSVRENMARRYPAAVPGLVNIGLLHTSLDGREGHDDYAPCSPADLAASGYDYWALGHVHAREVVADGTDGGPWIVYPGALQGRSPREPGEKGAMLVTLDAGRVADVAFAPCDVARFAVARIDLADLSDAEEIETRERAALMRAAAEGDGRPVVVRARYEGATALDAMLRAQSRRLLTTRLDETALGLGEPLWIEKVEIATRPSVDAPSLSLDPMFEAALDAAAADPDVIARLGADVAAISGLAPMPLDLDPDPAVWLARARARLTDRSAA